MDKLILHLLPIILGFFLDLLLGDPQSWPHPVRFIGKAISLGEKKLRPIAKDNNQLFVLGAVLSIAVILLSFLIPFILLWLAGFIGLWLKTLLAAFFCYQALAAKSLKVESMKVYDALIKQDLPTARQALSWIVGRDTANLTDRQIAKAAVETVSENCSDGVIAPLFYLCIGGPALGFMYKAVNTLDSMIGYKNDKYLYFGKFAARLDDIANFIPSRLCALLMLLAGRKNFNFKNGVKIWLRDRFNHQSPNSAQTEAACAGLLSIQLAGDAYYGGRLINKPAIGEPIRPVEAEDIKRANSLMYATAFWAIALFGIVMCIFGR